MGLAALIPISVMIGYAIGHYLDLWQSTTYFTPIFLILGAVAGLVGLVRNQTNVAIVGVHCSSSKNRTSKTG